MWWTLPILGVLAVSVLAVPSILIRVATRRAAGVDRGAERAELLAKRWRDRRRPSLRDGVRRLPTPDSDAEG